MHVDVLTLFPSMFGGVFEESIISRACQSGRLSIALHNIRDHAEGKHRVTDDTPYGGGGGMIMKPEPIFNTVEALLGLETPAEGYRSLGTEERPPVILLSPQGRLFGQAVARELAACPRLVLICGRYEGVDERVREFLCSDEISIGDYVLSGGEIAAMVVVDSVARLLPGVLGDPNATAQDSHSAGLLEHPHYTRPADYRGHGVPEVLLSGHHAEVARWRRQKSLRRTFERRPDMLEKAALSEAEREFLRQLDSSAERDDR